MNSNLIFKWLRDNRVVPEEEDAQLENGVMAFLPVEFGDPSFAELTQSSSGASSPSGGAVSATRVDITLSDGHRAQNGRALQRFERFWSCTGVDDMIPSLSSTRVWLATERWTCDAGLTLWQRKLHRCWQKVPIPERVAYPNRQDPPTRECIQ